MPVGAANSKARLYHILPYAPIKWSVLQKAMKSYAQQVACVRCDTCLTGAPGLDYLTSPTGPIRDAQRLAAEAFGADHTWFLVNGCSVGIHASVMAVTRTGSDNRNGVLLVARNCHSSAFAAMVIAGKGLAITAC